LDNLGKGEDLNRNATLEAGKVDDLNKTSIKEEELGWDLKADDLERKR
jgi:hypothetical protein